MTMGDVFALVAGVALSYFLITNINFASVMVVRSPMHQLVQAVLQFFQGATMALSAVTLSRVAVYRRMPSAPEWMAIVVACSLPGDWPWLQVDHWIASCRWAFPSLDGFSYVGMRWVGAGLFSAAIAIGLGVLRLGRTAYPSWLKTLMLAWLVLVAMSGPLWVFSQHGADLITPTNGFGPGVLSTLYRGACLLLAALPMGVLFGLPAVAALVERIGGRRWSWAEWSASSATILTGFVAMRTYQGEFKTPSPAWAAEWLLVLAWFVAVALASRWILLHLGERWRRWVEGPDGRDQPSPATSDSDVSID